jgi:redox-sensing transcriptional repressor
MRTQEPVSMRLLEYKNTLRKLKALGFTRVYSSNLADTLGISSSLVRRDFGVLDTSGNKRGGYRIDDLLGEIARVLRKDTISEAVLVGAGKLGAALVGHGGFEEESIKFVAAFDSDRSKLTQDGPVPVYHTDDLVGYVTQHGIKIAALAVPTQVVQRLADLLVLAGVKGFLNFASIRLVLPGDCFENHVDLAMELEKLVYQVVTASQGQMPKRTV